MVELVVREGEELDGVILKAVDKVWMTESELVEITKRSPQTVCRHIQRLREMGLIEGRRRDVFRERGGQKPLNYKARESSQ